MQGAISLPMALLGTSAGGAGEKQEQKEKHDMSPIAMVANRIPDLSEAARARRGVAVFASVNGHAQAVIVTTGSGNVSERRNER